MDFAGKPRLFTSSKNFGASPRLASAFSVRDAVHRPERTAVRTTRLMMVAAVGICRNSGTATYGPRLSLHPAGRTVSLFHGRRATTRNMEPT